MSLAVLAIAGPTASGKSSLAVALAQRIACGGWPWPAAQVITVDSAQVYRGMDIGTAKPDAAARAAVPHHLLDLLDPAQTYSAAQFVGDARAVIEGIHAQGHLPILVGGTMLYFRALLDGLSALPPADSELRKRLEADAATRGWPALHARLVEVDPETAARLHPNDAQRIGRALEVFELTGTPLSRLHAASANERGYGGKTMRLALVAPRETLHARIETRLRTMMALGFTEEVSALRARGDLHLQLPSMRAVGYRQLWRHLDGEYAADEAFDRCLYATRQYAKRQLTWLRGDMRWRTLDATEPVDLERVLNDMSATQQS